MEPNWSTGGTSSETGGSTSSTHNPSSYTPYIDVGGSSSSPYTVYPPYNYGLQHPDLLRIVVRQAIKLTTVALHSIHMLHMPVIVVQVDILFPFLLSNLHILYF